MGFIGLELGLRDRVGVRVRVRVRIEVSCKASWTAEPC